MFNLGPSGSAADTYHQRFIDEGLPPALSRRGFASFDRSAYDPETLQVGIETWQHRALDEYRSQVGFTELLLSMTDVGFAFDILGTCVRVVRDEARHVELCRRMYRALGGEDAIPDNPDWVRADPSLPPLRRVLRTVVGSLCIGETFSVRLLAAARKYTADPLARAVNDALTADEAVHSRFGWTVLESLAPHLGKEDRKDLEKTLPDFLGAAESLVLAAVRPEPGRGGNDAASLAQAPKSPFGYLPDKVLDRVFQQTLDRDILRPLEALGIPGRRAWGNRRRPR